MTLSHLEYKTSYLDWMGTIINKKKMEVFTHLLSLPIESVEFTNGVFDELNKIFEAQDRYIGYQFTNPELSNDFDEYRKMIGDLTFWQTKGFKAMKVAINSITILDLPAIQQDKEAPREVVDRFPRPYYYFLDVQKVRAFDVDSDHRFEFLIFSSEKSDKVAHAFDDGHFRTYKEDDGGKWNLVSEVPHDLGYTPARSFWSTPYESSSKLQKKGPQSDSLGKFDWLLALYTFTKHVELYAGFPVDVMYEQRCDYRDAQGNTCEGGKVRRLVKTDLQGMGNQTVFDDCPNCKDKQLLGPGTVLTAPGMGSKDDPDLIQGMNRISADKESLEYLLDRIDRYEAKISINMIGFISEGIREAMNKEQVSQMLEGRISALQEVKTNFENIHRWVLEGIARLRYGPKALISVTCNYGKKWFLQSVSELQEQFEKSKANGLANFELASQFDQIGQTKYKSDPTMLERFRTLSEIEPFQNYTIAEVTSMTDKFGLNKNLVRLKLDFSYYVSKFEREYMNIGSFMRSVPFEVKVAFIQEKLNEYVLLDYPIEEPTPPPTPPIPPAGAGNTQ